MIPYPDLTDLPASLARAVVRMVRLVNEMHRRHPDLDCFAIDADDPLDRQALAIVAQHVDGLNLSFRLLPAPPGLLDQTRRDPGDGGG
ncbi:hypothetical protein [Rhodospirillum centenum]|uniref:Uncharacterized protein n=1 Tax=Rhodospirillum centenum (strain ATCC 51521 / SW) TaxID=414684 RepID=B6ISA9_RHOCS|nr:hypothetical protein [Rhodospirillum centenum]ACI98345.1 hypothetical protein RC1_0917 [Rhodospirillum centenum SW]